MSRNGACFPYEKRMLEEWAVAYTPATAASPTAISKTTTTIANHSRFMRDFRVQVGLAGGLRKPSLQARQ